MFERDQIICHKKLDGLNPFVSKVRFPIVSNPAFCFRQPDRLPCKCRGSRNRCDTLAAIKAAGLKGGFAATPSLSSRFREFPQEFPRALEARDREHLLRRPLLGNAAGKGAPDTGSQPMRPANRQRIVRLHGKGHPARKMLPDWHKMMALKQIPLCIFFKIAGQAVLRFKYARRQLDRQATPLNQNAIAIEPVRGEFLSTLSKGFRVVAPNFRPFNRWIRKSRLT
jgi:hypothetical protein